MSHDHRDEHQLVDPVVAEPEPDVVAPPVPVVSNSEAEKRAAERRKAEGVPEQTTQHQFTGDLPEATRGGTDIETRIRLGDDGDDDDARRGLPAGTARRGPPAPRAFHAENEDSWIAPPTLDGATLTAGAASWAKS
jgi:hypothetical protein